MHTFLLSAENWYLVCFGVGLVLSVLAFVGGFGHLQFGHLHLGHIHAGHAHGGHLRRRVDGGAVDDVHDEVGQADRVEGGAERLDQLVGQFAHEPHRVGHQDRMGVEFRQGCLARGSVRAFVATVENMQTPRTISSQPAGLGSRRARIAATVFTLSTIKSVSDTSTSTAGSPCSSRPCR